METRHEHQKPPDGLGEQRTSNELVKLIRKLRWTGSEKKRQRWKPADLRKVPAADSVVAASGETD